MLFFQIVGFGSYLALPVQVKLGTIVKTFIKGPNVNPQKSIFQIHFEGSCVFLFFDRAMVRTSGNASAGGLFMIKVAIGC